MSSSEPLRVFISYAHRDGATLAEQLQRDLAENFDTWLDTQRLSVGEVWNREIEQAIDRTDVILALLSSPILETAMWRC